MSFKIHDGCHKFDCRPKYINKKILKFSNLIRKLWVEHVTWTRLTIESLVFDLPDREPTINRLLRNPSDVKRALVPFYGEELTTILEQLLTEHLTIAARLVQAAIDGDQERANNARIQWYINAVQIAQFLACINPCWSKEQWQEMLFEHLRITELEAVFMITGQYQQGVDIYDEIEKQALEMADLMTFGIIAQFPGFFD